jgi:peptidoglycan/xylan/chitin deacetylase (PgdA/CDA1 family)
MRKAGITGARYFIPPYEHYNSTVSSWARQMGLQVVNYTPGTATNGDYTLPSMKNYYSCETIFNKIWECEKNDPDGLGGHIMLIHLGTEDGRTDKFYNHLPELIEQLKAKGYTFTPLRPE